MDFNTLVTKARKAKNLPPFDKDELMLVFDPGHTTGWCIFHHAELLYSGQADTTDIENATTELQELIARFKPNVIGFEDYRVYKWRAKHHVGSELLTTQVIGCIKTLAAIHQIPTFKQPPHVAKKFCPDSSLKEWGFFQKGKKHANDAIRHACYAQVFATARKIKGTQSHSVG